MFSLRECKDSETLTNTKLWRRDQEPRLAVTDQQALHPWLDLAAEDTQGLEDWLSGCNFEHHKEARDVDSRISSEHNGQHDQIRLAGGGQPQRPGSKAIFSHCTEMSAAVVWPLLLKD